MHAHRGLVQSVIVFLCSHVEAYVSSMIRSRLESFRAELAWILPGCADDMPSGVRMTEREVIINNCLVHLLSEGATLESCRNQVIQVYQE